MIISEHCCGHIVYTFALASLCKSMQTDHKCGAAAAQIFLYSGTQTFIAG
jgi:hypothetical protein